MLRAAALAAAISLVASDTAIAQLAPRCAEDSPERRGQAGCTIVEQKPLSIDLKQPLYWHIDRFGSLERARSAVGPTGVAFDAAGASWLMTIGPDTSGHHGGEHVALVGPLELPPAEKYAIRLLAAAFTPGMYTMVHHHSGVEAIYVIEGDACYETSTRGFALRKGGTLTIAAGTLHRAVARGSSRRYVLGVIIHDAAQPPTMVMKEGAHPPLAICG